MLSSRLPHFCTSVHSSLWSCMSLLYCVGLLNCWCVSVGRVHVCLHISRGASECSSVSVTALQGKVSQQLGAKEHQSHTTQQTQCRRQARGGPLPPLKQETAATEQDRELRVSWVKGVELFSMEHSRVEIGGISCPEIGFSSL